MDIIDIISVSPINPAHGRHEVHAKNANGIPVTFTISPNALGCLTGYFDSFPSDDPIEPEEPKLSHPKKDPNPL